MSKIKSRHVFQVNPRENGGEAFLITTEICNNGDGPTEGWYLQHELTLMSYSNSASLNLGNAQLTPEKLREFANELERQLVLAKATYRD